jgi:hypothetical protein
MALLSILIAFPDLSPTFFRCLHEASRGADSCSWTQFLKRAISAPTDANGDTWRSELVGPLDSKAQARRWQELVRALEKLTATAADPKTNLALPEPLEAWADWVIPVGRLSFETGRSVITLTPGNSRTE